MDEQIMTDEITNNLGLLAEVWGKERVYDES